MKLDLEIVKFNSEDVVITSGEGCTPPDLGEEED